MHPAISIAIDHAETQNQFFDVAKANKDRVLLKEGQIRGSQDILAQLGIEVI